MSTITLYKGKAKDFTVTVTKNNAAISLAGYSMVFTVKNSLSDLDGDILISATASISENVGTFELSLSDTDITAKIGYEYDIQLIGGGKAYVIDRGNVTVKTPVKLGES